MSAGKSDNLLGMELGDYIIKRLIAKGGMGRVYEAEDRQLGRRVAIKIITLTEDAAEDLIHRFEREARVISQLDAHPNIVTIYRYGREEGITYFAMQYVSGDSLASYMKSVRDRDSLMEWDEVIHILHQVAAALDHAHSQGVIHRDVKPANIMLEHDPSQRPFPKRAILMDFGLVMSIDNTVTAGTAFGTPRYIAPEQAISSAQACAQSDVYSLGVVTYEMLTGQPPFEDDDTPISVALSHVTKDPPPPRSLRPDLPPAADAVIMKVLEKKPEDRYQTAAEFINALEAALLGVTPRPGLGASSHTPRNAGVSGVVLDSTSTPRTRKPHPTREFQVEPQTVTGVLVPVPTIDEPRRDHLFPSFVLLAVFIAIAVIIYAIFFQEDDKGNTDGISGDVVTELASEEAPTEVAMVAEVTDEPSVTPSDEPSATATDEATPTPTDKPSVTPSNEPSSIPTDEPSRTPTNESTSTNTASTTQVAVNMVLGNGTIELDYTTTLLTIRNNSSLNIKMLNVELKRDDTTFSLSDLGRSRLESWQPGTCAFVALVDAEYTPPVTCRGTPLELRYTSRRNFVWSGTDGEFEVLQNGQSLGICQLADGHCLINGIQES